MADITDMQAGKAGEFLVCADLIVQGFNAFTAGEGLPYDVVAQVPGRLVKIQVKSLRGPTLREPEPPLYIAIAMQCGKGGKSKYKADDVDVFAIVALDVKSIGYIHAAACLTCMEFRVEAYRGQYLSDRFNAASQRAIAIREAGNGLPQIAAQMGVSRAQAHRYLQGAGNPRVKGKYLADFPFHQAILGFTD